MREGSLAVEQLVDDESECPDIGLGPIDIFDIALGRHVEGRSDVYIFELFPLLLLVYCE